MPSWVARARRDRLIRGANHVSFRAGPQAAGADSATRIRQRQRRGSRKISRRGGGHVRTMPHSAPQPGQSRPPLDSRGNPDRRHWLQGGPVPFMPSETNADWPVRVPRIGGTPPADDADMVKLLTTGIWTTGARLRFPMPQFRMDRNDAEAVVAYLKTLPSQR